MNVQDIMTSVGPISGLSVDQTKSTEYSSWIMLHETQRRMDSIERLWIRINVRCHRRWFKDVVSITVVACVDEKRTLRGTPFQYDETDYMIVTKPWFGQQYALILKRCRFRPNQIEKIRAFVESVRNAVVADLLEDKMRRAIGLQLVTA